MNVDRDTIEKSYDEADPLHDTEEQPWLISYADLMTLLFGFFALMFSFASFDETSATRVTRALSKSFGAGVTGSRSVAEEVKRALAGRSFSKEITVTETGDELALAFKSSLFFVSGSADLVSDAEAPLAALIGSLKNQRDRLRIIVEGHTDDSPIATPQFKSNWELSSARAATIVHFLEAASFPPDHLEAVGFGSTRPAVPNRTEEGIAIPENQARNRRVLIRVAAYEPPGDAK